MIYPQFIGRQQLFLMLLERIEQGYYAPGSWLPAERALAQEFSMDRSAVRSALQQLEAQGLIVREAGRRPWVRGGTPLPKPPSDGSDASQNTEAGLRTIVAILPQHPIYPASLSILHGINATLRSTEAPFRLQIIDTHGGNESREIAIEKQALASVAQERIAGVVLWHMGGKETLPQLRELESQGTPVIFVDRCPPSLTCDFVGSDNKAGVESAVDYLWNLGHRRIAHLTTDEATTAVLERLEGYRGAMLTYGSTPKAEWVYKVSHNNTTDVGPAYEQFFALADPPTAVVAMNDSLAHHFITECEKYGKSVPEDISVVGFDDLERHSPRPALLTTLHQPFDKMGSRAADLLLRRLSQTETLQGAKQHILLPTPLVIRSTCRPISEENASL